MDHTARRPDGLGALKHTDMARARRRKVTTARCGARDELMQECGRLLEEERMTVEELHADGEAEALTDGNLRDLWLHYRSLLIEE